MRRDSLYVLCRLTPEDAAELSALEEKCFPSFWTAEQYAKALGKGSPYLSLGCRMDGRLAGYITVSEVAGELEIINVGVEPEMRGRGIATRLLQAILHQAREKSIFFYYLEVRSSNAPALSLYTRAGFRRSGVRRRYYADGEDALAMTMEAGHNLNQPQ